MNYGLISINISIVVVVVLFVFKHAVFSIFGRFELKGERLKCFFREHSNAVLNFKVFVSFSFLFFFNHIILYKYYHSSYSLNACLLHR